MVKYNNYKVCRLNYVTVNLVLLFLFYFLIICNLYYSKTTYKKDNPPDKQKVKRGGGLPLLKQKETLGFKANLATLWAATLQSLLTQLKEQLEKDSAKHKELSSTVLIDQSAYVALADKESKQILASPSTIIWDHASDFANWAAQRIDDASASRGEQLFCNLAQTLITSPLLFQATSARATLVVDMAASTLSLAQSVGGGTQLATDGGGGRRVDWFVRVENSINL